MYFLDALHMRVACLANLCRPDRAKYGIRTAYQCDDRSDAVNYGVWNRPVYKSLPHPNHLLYGSSYYDYDSIMHYGLVAGKLWLEGEFPPWSQPVRSAHSTPCQEMMKHLRL